MSAQTILFLNQKGGVGKTTSAVNLGSALAQRGKKVLLIDLDSQGNLTSATSIDNRKKGFFFFFFAIASNINMAGLNIELVEEERREFFLKNALLGLDERWDYIIADCPPSLGLVTVNAMVWAKQVIIPMQCEYFAMEGLNLLMRTVGNMKKSLNPDLQVLGILFTMYSKRTKLANEVVEDISSFFPHLVFNTMIPRNIRIAEAPSHGLPINVYDSASSGTKAYKALAEEVIARVARNH